jgi:prepilin-type N-terminal cleavage/methylation domain-containing protein
MRFHARKTHGYSLIEILFVLAILGILSVVGVTMIGNRQASSVRTMVDELEGALVNARQYSASTGRDIQICNWGNWTAANPLFLAFGDASLTPAVIKTTALDPNNKTVTVLFHYLPNDTNQARARIVLAGSGDWGTAGQPTSAGVKNDDIQTLNPFASQATWKDLVKDDTFNTFNTAPQQTVVISGNTSRFNTTFIIEVVGTSPSAGPLPGSPMGLIVVLANGSEIYKFYNPGALEGNHKWRRI